MFSIVDIKAREILDSRGNPTVEVDVKLEGGGFGRACVPSGASTGSFEAIEKRDGDLKRYKGKGVLKAISTIEDVIKPKILGFNANLQSNLDNFLIKLDATENKYNLGANAVLGVSLAVAKASADALKLPLYQYLGGISASRMPIPLLNIINGGIHADNRLDIQEFMIVPSGFSSFAEMIRAGCEVFHKLKEILKKNGYSVNVGDEGGFAPNLDSTRQALDLISDAVEKSSYSLGKEIFLALDVAANELYEDGVYNFRGMDKKFTTQELVDFYDSLTTDYPISSIEDGLFEEDWHGWQQLTEKIGSKVQLVGDDLFVTNKERLQRGINNKVANCILIKPNQIGTITETLETIRLAQNNNYNVILSHRSGETEDTSIADIAVATNAGQIKSGSLSRSERLAKYNQLLRIEENISCKFS